MQVNPKQLRPNLLKGYLNITQFQRLVFEYYFKPLIPCLDINFAVCLLIDLILLISACIPINMVSFEFEKLIFERQTQKKYY